MSAAINYDANYFWCGSCERAGSMAKLVKDQLGLDWPDAYRRVEEWTGITRDRKAKRTKRKVSDLL